MTKTVRAVVVVFGLDTTDGCDRDIWFAWSEAPERRRPTIPALAASALSDIAHDAAVDAQSGARGRRGVLRTDVHHHVGDLIGGGEALDQ